MKTFTVYIYRDSIGGFWAEITEIPKCYVLSKNLKDLKRCVMEAIKGELRHSKFEVEYIEKFRTGDVRDFTK
jgi:predicted RNase H-like HicB family nuclease